MDKLGRMRREIDSIDACLAELFERRMRIADRIGRFKKASGLPVFDAEREEAVIRRNVERIADARFRSSTERFFEAIMALSRERQAAPSEPAAHEGLKAGFQGVSGAFSEEALVDYFGPKARRAAYPTWEAVFEGIRRGEIDFGVVPIENSSAGAVTAVYDLLKDYDFRIVGERCVAVTHHLLGIPGAVIDDIEEVYSHEQALEQCAAYLKRHPTWKITPYPNTAMSAEFVRDRQDRGCAAIAGGKAAELYGLAVIERGINTRQNNTTRFVVVSRSTESDPAADKVSVILATAHRAGALFGVLRFFAEAGISILKLESRPMKDRPWEYYFYMDFQGNLADSAVAEVVEKVRSHSAYFKLLGNYRSSGIAGELP